MHFLFFLVLVYYSSSRCLHFLFLDTGLRQFFFSFLEIMLKSCLGECFELWVLFKFLFGCIENENKNNVRKTGNLQVLIDYVNDDCLCARALKKC